MSEKEGQGCKKKVAQPDSKKQCTKKRNKSPSPPPSDAYAENRMPPWWGSNLLMVKPLYGPSPRELKKPASVNVGLNETLDEADDFLEEFQKSVVNPKIQDKAKSLLAVWPKMEEGAGTSEDEAKEARRKQSAYQEEIEDDSHLVNYLKYRAEQYRLKQQLKQAALNNVIASPAMVGIPLTTPRSSPIPRRPTKAFDEDTSFLATIGEYPDDHVDLLEESIDEEYREWAMRLKRLEWECEKNIKNLDETETNEEAGPGPSCSRNTFTRARRVTRTFTRSPNR